MLEIDHTAGMRQQIVKRRNLNELNQLNIRVFHTTGGEWTLQAEWCNGIIGESKHHPTRHDALLAIGAFARNLAEAFEQRIDS